MRQPHWLTKSQPDSQRVFRNRGSRRGRLAPPSGEGRGGLAGQARCPACAHQRGAPTVEGRLCLWWGGAGVWAALLCLLPAQAVATGDLNPACESPVCRTRHHRTGGGKEQPSGSKFGDLALPSTSEVNVGGVSSTVWASVSLISKMRGDANLECLHQFGA